MVKFYSAKKHILLFIGFAFSLFLTPAVAQVATISTTSSYTANNGNGMVTFNFQNTNTSAVTITSISSILSTTSSATFKLWYKTTAINGSPGLIDSTNGWSLAANQQITSSLGSGTNTTPEPVLTNLSLVIPAGATYGIVVSGILTAGTTGAQRYYTIVSTAPTTFSAGGCTLISGANVGYGYTSATSTSPFSPRGFTGSVTFTGTSLPVTLKDFTATLQGQNAKLDWESLTELNTQKYTVQRSDNGTDFFGIGDVAAKGAGKYTTTDKNIDAYATGDLLYYRLLSTDFDGKTQYSKTVSVKVSKRTGVVFTFPNPFVNNITIRTTVAAPVKAYLKLVNTYGQSVLVQQASLTTGTNTVKLATPGDLPHGNYLLQVTIEQNTSTYKLTH